MSCPLRMQDCKLGCWWHRKLSWTDQFQGHLERTLRSLSGCLRVLIQEVSQTTISECVRMLRYQV